MSSMTAIFLGTFDTLRSVKTAIDSELDLPSSATPMDKRALEQLWASSDRHAALTRKLQDMMLDHGAENSFHYEVELLREAFENTKAEIERRLAARAEPPAAAAPKSAATKPRRDQDALLQANLGVRLFYRDLVLSAELEDVSEQGALLGQPERLPAGTRVTLRYLDLFIRAQVDWSENQMMALRFRTPLAPEALQLLQQALPTEQLAKG